LRSHHDYDRGRDPSHGDIVGVTMRRTLGCLAATAAALATTAVGAVGPASAATRASGAAARSRPAAPSSTPSPTRKQIRAAMSRAARSSYLWATVNVCTSHGAKGGVIGIRGEMPALGFRSTLSMTIQLRQYVTSAKRYEAVKGSTARRTVTVGRATTGIYQDGAEFPFTSATGRLDALVTFTWTRDGHRLGHVSRTTTGGHPSAAYGRPRHHSTATCRL
jgi:hypothetical protein